MEDDAKRRKILISTQATAYFARRFAELKWPPDGSLPSLVLGGSLDLSVTLEPRVAWSPSVEESRSHVQIRVNSSREP